MDMTHVWRHPNYYKKLRAQARKLTSSQASGSQASNLPLRAQAEVPSEPGSGSQNQGTSVPSPCPGYKQQG